MPCTISKLENHLLQSAAGRAVFDALVQANVNLQDVSLEMVKQMLVEECRFLRSAERFPTLPLVLAD